MMVQSMVLNMNQFSFVAVLGWAEAYQGLDRRCKRLQACLWFVNGFWVLVA